MKTKLISLTFLALAVIGCEAEKPATIRDNVRVERLRTFAAPEENLRLINNKIFFWAPTRTPEDVATVLSNAKNIDRLDVRRMELEPKLAEVEARFAPLEAERKQLDRAIKALAKEVTKLQSDIAAEEARGDQADQEKIKLMKAQLAQKQGEQTGKSTRKSAVELELAPIVEAKAVLEAEAEAMSNEGYNSVKAIAQVAEWYKTFPSSVVLRPLGRGQYGVEISGWKMCFEDKELGDGVAETGEACADAPRDFSTDDHSISVATYDARGGIFEFDVFVNAAVTYRFHMLRARYADTDANGGAYFGGIVTRTTRFDDGRVEKREGVIKLADRIN